MSETSNNGLSIERAKSALRDMIAAISSPDNASKLIEAKNKAGNDMLVYMLLVFPLATEIQHEVIQNYGFSPDSEGLLEFTKVMRSLKNESQDIQQMNDELRSLLLPPMTFPYSDTSN